MGRELESLLLGVSYGRFMCSGEVRTVERNMRACLTDNYEGP